MTPDTDAQEFPELESLLMAWGKENRLQPHEAEGICLNALHAGNLTQEPLSYQWWRDIFTPPAPLSPALLAPLWQVDRFVQEAMARAFAFNIKQPTLNSTFSIPSK